MWTNIFPETQKSSLNLTSSKWLTDFMRWTTMIIIKQSSHTRFHFNCHLPTLPNYQTHLLNYLDFSFVHSSIKITSLFNSLGTLFVSISLWYRLDVRQQMSWPPSKHMVVWEDLRCRGVRENQPEDCQPRHQEAQVGLNFSQPAKAG